MDLEKIEIELKKRLTYPYRWGRKQSDHYDYLTRFIYGIESFDDLLLTIDNKFNGNPDFDSLKNYTLNRWFNFYSARAIENIFCSMNGVTPEIDSKNKTIDFSIKGTSFDHKTSVFPSGYAATIKEAKNNPSDLIKWLYENQSQQQRKHFKNRLFIILYSTAGEHWKLKAQIGWLKNIIESYVTNFNSEKLYKFSFSENTITLADIIWAICLKK